MKKSYLFILFVVINISVSADVLIKPFVEGSFSEIVEQRQDKIFALIFWSIDCPSCYNELNMLGKIHKNYSDIDIVLVSTDIGENQDELKPILEKYQLSNIESWVFRGDSEQKLRYEIDKTWYGELPRSYIFKDGKNTYVGSGVLSKEQLINSLEIN